MWPRRVRLPLREPERQRSGLGRERKPRRRAEQRGEQPTRHVHRPGDDVWLGLRRSPERPRELRSLRRSVRGRDAAMRPRPVRGDVQQRARELRRSMRRHSDEPQTLLGLQLRVQPDGDVRELAMLLSERQDPLWKRMREHGVEPASLRRLRDRVRQRDGLQRWRVPRRMHRRTRRVQQRVRRSQERLGELRWLRHRLHRRQRMHEGRLRLPDGRAALRAPLRERDDRPQQLRVLRARMSLERRVR